MFHSRPGGPAAQPPDLQKIEMPPKPKSSYNTQSQNTASSWKASKQWFGRWHYRQDCLIARSILHLATYVYWLTIHIVWASLLPTSQSSLQQNLLCFFLNLCAWSIYRSRLHLSPEHLCLFLPLSTACPEPFLIARFWGNPFQRLYSRNRFPKSWDNAQHGERWSHLLVEWNLSPVKSQEGGECYHIEGF